MGYLFSRVANAAAAIRTVKGVSLTQRFNDSNVGAILLQDDGAGVGVLVRPGGVRTHDWRHTLSREMIVRGCPKPTLRPTGLPQSLWQLEAVRAHKVAGKRIA
jgi:hypothetical protein